MSATLTAYCFPKVWQSSFGCGKGSIMTGDCEEAIELAVEVVDMGGDDLAELELVEIEALLSRIAYH